MIFYNPSLQGGAAPYAAEGVAWLSIPSLLLPKQRRDLSCNCIHVRDNLIIRKSHHRVPAPGQFRLAPLVVSKATIMASPVNLNDEIGRGAKKVDDIRADWLLSQPAHTELFTTQSGPEESLGERHLLSKLPCALPRLPVISRMRHTHYF